MDDDSERNQMKYAQALADFGDAGGYDAEVLWDFVTISAIGKSYESLENRQVATFSGGEQKLIVLEYLLRDRSEVLILDEPDNYLDVPGKIWLENQLKESNKTVVLISHDRELLSNATTHIVSLELGAAGNTAWVHGGSFTNFDEVRAERFSRLEELKRRWDEEHVQLKKTRFGNAS